MADRQKVNDDEVKRLLGLEEGPYVDLKDAAISPAKLSVSISAFANTSGGELFIGIREAGTLFSKTRAWLGFKDIEAANPIFQVLEKLNPIGGHYRATFLSADGQPGHVLHLIIFKSKDILRSTEGVPYVRRGAQNLPGGHRAVHGR